MNTSFVPSLQHLTCTRLVTSLFNTSEVQRHFRREEYKEIKAQVSEKISYITPCTCLQAKLITFINPLISELDDWFFNILREKWYGFDYVSDAVLETLPQCWLSDGTINRQMSIKAIVKNEEMQPLERFIYACTYCLFDDVLELEKTLFKIEKAYLRNQSTPLVKHFLEWLESSPKKDCEIFFTSILETNLWNDNVYILKHALGTLSPAGKSQYLLKALIGKEITKDVMRFCLSIMTKDEQEQIFKESPVEVFRCISSWPTQSLYYDVVRELQPHLTEEAYLKILEMLLQQIEQNLNMVCVQQVEILQNFWSLFPRHLQDIALKGTRRFKQLQFLLAFDGSQEFPKEIFSSRADIHLNNLIETALLLERQGRMAETN